MKAASFKKAICLSAAAVFVMTAFSGCSMANIREDESSSDTPSPEPYVQDTSVSEEENGAVFDGEFAINSSGSDSLNPYTFSNNPDKDASSLIYDSFFVLDNSFSPSSELCENYTTDDGQTYDFRVVSGVKMHDGSELDASDVVYSINEARSNSRYSQRLLLIDTCDSTGDYTFRVTLKYPDYRFTSLLDIPIISYGTAGDYNPPGTGPYMMADGGGSLIPFDNYRNKDYVPKDKIVLKSFPDKGVPSAFLSHELDFLHSSYTGIDDMNIRIKCERSNIETSTLQYIGINMENPYLSYQPLRQAIYRAVDREYIAHTVMNSGAVPAGVIISPCASFYEETWTVGKTYSLEESKKLLEEMELKDTNRDKLLEFPGAEGYSDMTLRLMVNEENEHKVSAAQHIADELKSIGLNVELDPVSWEEYTYSLTSGEYDMYYGEARLTADFNLDSFFSEGGSLGYGGIADSSITELNAAFLAADEKTVSSKASALCSAVYDNSTVIPVVYTRESVLSHWNTITGMAYSQSGIFSNIGASSFITD